MKIRLSTMPAMPHLFVRIATLFTSAHVPTSIPIAIKPLEQHFQINFRLDRQRLPDALASVFNKTVVELDCTEAAFSSQNKHPTPQGLDQLLAICCTDLASAYCNRYLHLGAYDDAVLQLTYSTFALGFAQISGAVQADALRVVGLGLLARYQRVKDPNTVQLAIEAHRYALHLAEQRCLEALVFRTDLALALHARYFTLGSQEDLLEAVEVLYHVLDHCPPDHCNRGQATAHLSNCFTSKYLISGDMDNLYRSLALAYESLALCSPGHRDRPKTLFILGGALAHLFETTGELDHLNAAISYAEEVIQSCLQGHPTRNATLVLLCHVLWRRSSRLGNREDLDRAAHAGQDCLKANPSHSNAVMCLGTIYSERFNLYGDPDDLDQLVRMRRRSLVQMPPGHPNHDRVLNNLALALEAKSNYTLDPDYLDEAIVLTRKALAARPDSHSWSQHTSFNLANALRLRFSRGGKLEDLLEAQQLHDSWLSSGFDVPPHTKYWLLKQISAVRRAVFERFGDPDDLSFAIDILEEASKSLSDNQVDVHKTIGDLGSCYVLRSQSTGSLDDSTRAMDLLTRALDAAPPEHPERSRFGFEMAKVYASRPESSSQNLRSALDAYILAATNTVCSSAARLMAGIKTLEMLDNAYHNLPDVDGNIHAELLQAYRVTMQLLPEIAYFGLDPHLRLKALTQAPMLAGSSAACAVGNGQIESAIELLEEGRAVFWSQHLRLRTSADDLPPELAEELKATSTQLEKGQVGSEPLPSSDTTGKSEDRLTEQRKLSQRFTELVQRTRLHPGFDRFMLPDTYSTLAQAAHRAPVVLLISDPRFCGALIIRSPTSQPEQCDFDSNLSANHVKSMYSMLHQTAVMHRGVMKRRAMRPTGRKNTQADSLYKNLWSMVMRRIVLTLGLQKSHGLSRPRLTICATGSFTHLPVHAAGSENEGVWDYFVPSYTPTLGALLSALQQYSPIRKSAVRLLLATVPQPLQPWAPLPHVREEVKCIEEAFTLDSQLTHVSYRPALTGFTHFADASCGDVLDGLAEADILHLACHGYHNLQSTLESGFIMHDKTLTITDLMRVNLPNSFLAFLSACETAKSAAAQQDQAIHLAAAMLFAGFKSVIGTMW